ncbi:hypothetical protein [Dyella sp. S184]|uniref:hypothetical protein n=1 Tax=Dyella sp. S184 TaxID=1641862 RepID=UPI00131B974F|nr:hypothetical protein [Dyella sp. S184]
MKTALIVILFIVVVAIAFMVGLRVGDRRATTEDRVVVDSIQADLVFNRILDERKMQSMLSKGCVAETQNALNINLDQDTKLLAEFFKGKLTPDARKYVSDRDPELMSSLGAFKSKYGNSWTEMECNK